jgi:predicted RNase H-like nuclease (RuvC/YqgF family)
MERTGQAERRLGEWKRNEGNTDIGFYTSSKLKGCFEKVRRQSLDFIFQIDDLKQQHNYDVKHRDLEIFKLQNKLEELERSATDPGTQQLEQKLKSTEEKLMAMAKVEEESQRMLKVRSGVIKDLENKMQGMQQQIEQLCFQVNRRHDFESEVSLGFETSCDEG